MQTGRLLVERDPGNRVLRARLQTVESALAEVDRLLAELAGQEQKKEGA